MTINQRQQVLIILDNIDNIDIDDKLVEKYPGQNDFTKINIGKYSASEMMDLIYKMTEQLKNELEKGLKYLLPFTENFSNDFGSVNLEQDLNQMYSYLVNKKFEHVEPILDKLIHYQIKNGFWDKSGVKKHSIDSSELKKQKVSIDLNQKAIDKNIESYNGLSNAIDDKIKSFDNYVQNKKEELAQISNSLENAKNQLAEIMNIEANISNKETEIKGILINLAEKVEKVTVNINNYQEEFKEIKTKNSNLKIELEAKINDASAKLTKAKDDLSFVESKKEQIETLTGMAADGALGSKFDQRQVKLNNGLIFWKWAVPIMTVLAGAWVVIVFKYLMPSFNEEWLNIIISILKTIPGFILLGFVFSQYKRERNLQEEYAFKSAVAMTLTAYSEMLAKADTDDNISRQQMLLKSIELVYNQPQIYPERVNKLSSLNTKDFNDTLKTLTEAVKNLKN
ncbi:coiled-coil domain-containing protein [Flavobacterium sp.]|uniref:coiled-coil domain-containing protein n=1 Tax=Flavobacterium sp. TaxID=239 RepID=UPI004047CC2A